jgi:large subunit ribosomal protein L9
MEVILMERIEKLGQMGDVVRVKPGYARNYLLPKGKARRATKENLAVFEEQRAQLEAENLERRQEAEKVAEKMQGLSVIILRQAGESGQLYGSVNGRDIAEAVTEAGFTVGRSQIDLNKVIKTLGLHDLQVRLHAEVSVDLRVNVARTEAEAEAQAKSGVMVTAAPEEPVAESDNPEILPVEKLEEAEEETAEQASEDS